jgi:hypothetical protein
MISPRAISIFGLAGCYHGDGMSGRIATRAVGPDRKSWLRTRRSVVLSADHRSRQSFSWEHTMKTADRSIFLFALGVLLTLAASSAPAQSPSLMLESPNLTAPGRLFCAIAAFSNSGPTGYGPYLRVSLAPAVTFASARDDAGTVTATAELVFPASGELTDPLTGTTVTGTVGGTLLILEYAAASIANLENEYMVVCSRVSTTADGVTPVDLLVQPVFQLGDSPGGTNGPIEGSPGVVAPAVIEPLVWRWSFATESGHLFSDGTLSDASGPFTFEIFDLAVTNSSEGNALVGGIFFENQSPQAMEWNGIEATEFSRLGGIYTNGSNYFHIDGTWVYGFFSDGSSATGDLSSPDEIGRTASGPLTLVPLGPPLIFQDGFETGSDTNWSSSSP